MSNKLYEYEERGFLTEANFKDIKEKLDSIALKITPDNKISYFFVLPDVNVSIASSPTKTVVKYKGGQLGKGNGFEEYEFSINQDSLHEAIKLFTALLKIKPQVSEQFRINYILDNEIEVALKYTQTWGFHLEIEKVYSANNEELHEIEKEKAKNYIQRIADQIGVSFITDNEMDKFKLDCDSGISRGEYDAEEFRNKYGSLFGF